MKFKNTITLQLILIISISTAVIGFVSFSLFYIHSTEKYDNLFHEKITKESDYLLSSITENLWNLDIKNTTRVLDDLYQNQEVVSIKLESEDFNYNPPLKKGNEKYFIEIKNRIIVKSDISGHPEQEIGVINIIYTNEAISRANHDTFVTIFIVLLIIIIVIAFLLKKTFNYVLKKPFDIFNEGFDKIAEGDYDYVISMMKRKNMKEEFKPLLKNLTKMAHDIQKQMTLRNDAEKKLVEAKEKAEVASQAKSEFLANMSHEIRTPMNGIIGVADMIVEVNKDEHLSQLISLMQSSSISLLTILNDIIDLSKIESGQVIIEKINFNLLNIIEDVAELLASRIYTVGLELIIDYPQNKSLNFKGDPLRIKQCLTNLVSNAIKFTETGHIIIKVRINDIEENSDIKIDIIDTGIGMSEDEQNIVFGKFTQADGSTTRKYGGTGLGLSITKQLVELLGGSIELKSEKGKGSVFSINLNLARLKNNSAKFIESKNVLVIEDNEITNNIYCDLCKSTGFEVIPAFSIVDAKNVLKNIDIDLILFDNILPDGLGIEYASELSHSLEYKNIPKILISGYDIPNDFNDNNLFISIFKKPLLPSRLMKQINKIFFNAPKTEPGITRIETYFKANILIVDDIMSNVEILRLMLMSYQCKVDIALNGFDAIEKIKEMEYDLVFTDCMMPVMTGYEVACEIRKLEKELKRERCSIVALTGKTNPENRKDCEDAGMDDVVIKPARKLDIENILKVYCKPATSIIEKTKLPSKVLNNGFDMDYILDQSAFDEFSEMNKIADVDLIEIFINEINEILEKLKDAIDNNEIKLIPNLGHSIKSPFRTLGITKLANIGEEIEKNPENIEQVKELYKELKKEWEKCHSN